MTKGGGAAISTRIGFWIHRRGSRVWGTLGGWFITSKPLHHGHGYNYSNESTWEGKCQSHYRRQWSEWTRINPQASFCVFYLLFFWVSFFFPFFLRRYFVCDDSPKDFTNIIRYQQHHFSSIYYGVFSLFNYYRVGLKLASSGAPLSIGSNPDADVGGVYN